MPTTCSDFPPKSPQTKQKDGRFFSKYLTTEFSRPKSFEDYHGGPSASVPFPWESQPGTPKVKLNEGTTTLPPLTPPPSYYSTATKRPTRKNSRPTNNLLHAIFPKRNASKPRLPLSPASSSSSSSSSFASSPISQCYSVPISSPVITALNSHRRDRMSSPIMSFDRRMKEEEHEYELPVSTFCCSRGVNDRSGGCYSSIIKVLLRDYK